MTRYLALGNMVATRCVELERHDKLSKTDLLIRDTPLGKAYVLGTFLTREVTDMGFKVASRVRGLSDEAFREAFGA